MSHMRTQRSITYLDRRKRVWYVSEVARLKIVSPAIDGPNVALIIRFEREGEERLARWIGGDEWLQRGALRRLFAEAEPGDPVEAPAPALGLPHHRLHESRHFYAIRAIRAGTPCELVARQLGHADVAMVAKVYGRFAPRSDERDRWKKIAAAHDQASEKKSDVMGAVVGAIAKHPKMTKRTSR